MKALKVEKTEGLNTETLKYDRFKCRVTRGIEIPDWRIVGVDEPNPTCVYVTIQILVGENPQDIISDLESYKGRKNNIVLEHLDEKGEICLSQTRTGYIYGGTVCQAFRASVDDNKPMTMSIRFYKPLSN